MWTSWQWHTHSFPWKSAAGWVHISHLRQSILETFSPRDAVPAVLMSICSCSLASKSRGLCAVPSPVSHSGVSTPSGQLSWQRESLASYQVLSGWASRSSAKAQVDLTVTLLLEVSSLCCQHVPLILLFCWENFHLLFSWVTPHLTVSWDIWVRSCYSYTGLGSAGASRVQRESCSSGLEDNWVLSGMKALRVFKKLQLIKI